MFHAAGVICVLLIFFRSLFGWGWLGACLFVTCLLSFVVVGGGRYCVGLIAGSCLCVVRVCLGWLVCVDCVRVCLFVVRPPGRWVFFLLALCSLDLFFVRGSFWVGGQWLVCLAGSFVPCLFGLLVVAGGVRVCLLMGWLVGRWVLIETPVGGWCLFFFLWLMSIVCLGGLFFLLLPAWVVCVRAIFFLSSGRALRLFCVRWLLFFCLRGFLSC
ncbi:hypothetical protein [Pseudomonas syringae]|uniref:hypothetical protein n=1 Tax=Pseudomonas syringae TaxID=317 RepID=UPI001143BD5F|nr:hypothetical protein [Pseudomonas syringae]